MGRGTGYVDPPFIELEAVDGKKFVWLLADVTEVHGKQLDRFKRHFQKATQPISRKKTLVTHKTLKTPSGRYKRDNDDSLSCLFRKMDLDTIYKYVANILCDAGYEITTTQLKNRYRHANAGVQRMSLGNVARRALKEII